MGTTRRELRDVVGGEALHERFGRPRHLARDAKLAHVRDVEEPRPGAHRAMLLHDPGVRRPASPSRRNRPSSPPPRHAARGAASASAPRPQFPLAPCPTAPTSPRDSIVTSTDSRVRETHKGLESVRKAGGTVTFTSERAHSLITAPDSSPLVPTSSRCSEASGPASEISLGLKVHASRLQGNRARKRQPLQRYAAQLHQFGWSFPGKSASSISLERLSSTSYQTKC